MKQREDWVDALRALAIVLVVLGHQIPEITPYFVVTSPVKMPLFFAISGYLFTLKVAKTYYKKVLLTLIVPWIALGLLPQLLMMPIKGITHTLCYFENMLSGEVLWFMPCFIIASILFFHIYKLTRMSVVGGG